MKIRNLFLAAATLLLLAAPAGAQTVYDDPRRDDVDMDRRGMDARDVRDMPPRASVPPRVYKMDVAEVDRRADNAFRQTVNSRKLGAADWQELRRQRSQIDDLKARIRAGHTVSPSEVDRALGLNDQKRPGY